MNIIPQNPAGDQIIFRNSAAEYFMGAGWTLKADDLS